MYGWVDTSVQVKEFAGIKRIMEFAACPVEHRQVDKKAIAEFFKRGEKASSLVTGGYKSYRGKMTMITTSRADGMITLESVESFVDGRIVIDVIEYTNHEQYDRIRPFPIPTGLASLAGVESLEQQDPYNPLSLLMLPQFPDHGLGSTRVVPEKLSLHSKEKTTDLLASHRWTDAAIGVSPEAFCSGVVRGYCLSSKAWATFRVDNISEIKWNETAFDHLVMSDARKTLIKAAIDEQSRNKTKHDDIVEGKGQGLIMLFSEPPGTGKPLTAESIADRLHLPLYALDAGQLGDSIEDVERRLQDVLRLVASWEAVLLLDEADVFVEKRVSDKSAAQSNKRVAGKHCLPVRHIQTATDLERSVLRVLEYFKGILVLTTNRPMEFDEAFYSRIHLTLRFPVLDQDSRKAIWLNFFGFRPTFEVEHHVTALSQLELNGRQIKNIFKLARLLAANQGENLSIAHVNTVLSVIHEDAVTDACE